MADLIPARDSTRARLVEVAAQLLATQGPDAVTTRSVAEAADVQAPTIYRIFGDKAGLLDAVAEFGYARYMAQKHPVDVDDDPVDNLRAGWELHIGFGLENPELFRLMHTTVASPEGQAVADAGGAVLLERVRRVAKAGRLRVAEHRAVELIRSAGTGVVFTLIDQPRETRDASLADLAWAAVAAVILTEAAPTVSSAAAAAVTISASLSELQGFTESERALLGEWLDRIARG